MVCPACNRPTQVLESRPADGGASVRRRRECSGCGERFTTYERRRAEPALVVKRDGRRQPFDRAKLRAALLRATHKRQVAGTEVESLVDRVERAIVAGGGELGAERIGELCLQGLGDLDRGAYLQFLGTLPPNPQFADSAAEGSVRGPRESSSFPVKAGSRAF